MPFNQAKSDSEKSKTNVINISTILTVTSIFVTFASMVIASWLARTNLADRKQQDQNILAIQNEQLALQKAQRNSANRVERRSRATVHPRQNQVEFTLLNEKVAIPTIELANSSERTIVELEVDWEFIGTDFGYVEGWNGLSKAKLDSQLLKTGESIECSKGFPEDKIALILGPRKNTEAENFFGYLIIRYRDSREDTAMTSKHRLVFTQIASSKVMLRLSEDSRLDFDDSATADAK
jgi:hypothetical protein